MDKQAAKASLKFSPVKLDKLKILVKNVMNKMKTGGLSAIFIDLMGNHKRPAPTGRRLWV